MRIQTQLVCLNGSYAQWLNSTALDIYILFIIYDSSEVIQILNMFSQIYHLIVFKIGPTHLIISIKIPLALLFRNNLSPIF